MNRTEQMHNTRTTAVTRKSKSEPHDLEDETRHDAVPEGEESEQEEIHKHGCR